MSSLSTNMKLAGKLDSTKLVEAQRALASRGVSDLSDAMFFVRVTYDPSKISYEELVQALNGHGIPVSR